LDAFAEDGRAAGLTGCGCWATRVIEPPGSCTRTRTTQAQRRSTPRGGFLDQGRLRRAPAGRRAL